MTAHDPRLYESSSGGLERVTFTGPTGERRQLWRQVGWLGQTGRVYELDKPPYGIEPGSFSPLWVLIDDDLTPMLEENAS